MKKDLTLRHRVKVLPFGDSLTQGDGTPSAYRYHLFRAYTEADIPFVFVGGNVSADDRMPPEYRRHCGRGGATTLQLLDYLTPGKETYNEAWLDAVREAEVVLLYVGTNDAHRGMGPDFPKNLLLLVDRLYELNPALITYIATLRSKNKLDEVRLAMNEFLLSFNCEEYYAKTGREIHIVDLNGRRVPRNLVTDYPADDAHPNEEGNRKLAEAWYNATARRLHDLSLTLAPERLGPYPAGLMTNLADTTLAPGRSVSFSATVMPAAARIPTLRFESSDPSVATVDDFGTVTARSEGDCEITCEAILGGITRTATVTVAGQPFCPAGDRPILFSSATADPALFTGTTEVVLPQYKTVRLRYPIYDGSLTTVASFPTADLCLSFGLKQTAGNVLGSGNRLVLSLGGIDLVFDSGMHQISLTASGALLGAYRQDKVSCIPYHYDLLRADGRLTLYRDGTPLIACPAPAAAPSTPLTIAWEKLYAVSYLTDITVAARD